MCMAKKITTITVSRDNRDRLAKFGDVGESFDDALGRVLDMAEEIRMKKDRTQNPLMARVLEPILA